MHKANNNPITINDSKISPFMCADDLVLLSYSDTCLNNMLKALSIYCKKWKLIVNLKKTKVVIFNKRNYEHDFLYNLIMLFL